MKFTAAAVVLATLAAESATAASLQHAHRHVHEKKSPAGNKPAIPDKRYEWTPPAGYDWHTDPGLIWNPNAAATPPPVAEPAVPAPTPVAAPAAPAAPANNDDSSAPESVGASFLDAGKSIMSDLSSHFVSSALAVAGKSVLAGANPTSANDFVWLGSDSEFTNTVTNNADSDITLVVFRKSDGSSQWIDQHAPEITVNIPQGSSVTLSMANGASGAFLGVYPDAQWASNGLLSTVIGEFTADPSFTTYDVSMLWANATQHGMTIDTGNGCQSSTDGQCVFICSHFDQDDFCGSAGSYELAVGDTDCNRAVIPDPWKPAIQVPTGGCTLYAGDDTKNVRTYFY